MNGYEILPTIADLIQQELVVIDNSHKNVTTNTVRLSEELGKRHYDIVRKVDSLAKKRLIDKRKLSLIYFLDSANRRQKSYDLNEEIALQVIMGLSGSKAEILHKKIAGLFVSMKAELAEWQKTRQTIIEPTKSCNDSIKWLQMELSSEIPESRKSGLIYQHIQEAITKAESGNARTKRETMTVQQLEMVEWLELRSQEEIERMKSLGVSAVDIRQSILDTLKA